MRARERTGELRFGAEVEYTAANWDLADSASADATARRKETAKLAAVGITFLNLEQLSTQDR